MSAADFGRIDTVRVLLENGAKVNGRDKDGDTALRVGEKYKYTGIIALLRSPPGIPQSRSPRNTTITSMPPAAPEAAPPTPVPAPQPFAASISAPAPQPQPAVSAPPDSRDPTRRLLDAAEAGDNAEVRNLLREGADVNAKGSYGSTALIGAAARGHTNTLRTLLEKGADVNAKDNNGRTALTEAAFEGHTDTVRALLEQGADVNVRDTDGDTALSKAEKQNYSDIIALLKAPPGNPQCKSLGNLTTSMPDASPTAAGPNSVPVAIGAQVLDKKTQVQAFYRMGLNMQLIEVLWSQTGLVAARCAFSIQQDLKKVGAPSDLIELANQAHIHLNLPPEERKGRVPPLMRDLRARLDRFCKAQTEGQFFYSAGGFTYALTLLGVDVKNPGDAQVSVEDSRRTTLPLAKAMVAQWSTTEGCKEHALSSFSAAAAILKKAQLIPTDGFALVKVSGDIEAALGGDEP